MGRPIFAPASRRSDECGTFAPVLFLFALHSPQSCRSHCSMRLKRASAHSTSIANGSRSVDTPTVRVRGIIQAPRPVWLGATGQGLEWSAGADDRLNAGIGPVANINNNVRGDMPFDEPFGARLQRSLQLAVFLLGPQRCRERARHFFATFEVRKVSHSIMRLQRSRQVE